MINSSIVYIKPDEYFFSNSSSDKSSILRVALVLGLPLALPEAALFFSLTIGSDLTV